MKRSLPHTTNSKTKKTKSVVFEVDLSEAEHIRALKHAIPTMSVDDIIHHWKGCAATRINSIQNVDDSKQIIDVWPQYKLPYGFRLVCKSIICISIFISKHHFFILCI